jgi:hypothetical protein
MQLPEMMPKIEVLSHQLLGDFKSSPKQIN